MPCAGLRKALILHGKKTLCTVLQTSYYPAMPATGPRMHVTPSPEVVALLKQMYALTGKRPATIVREILDEAEPVLRSSVEALVKVKENPRVAGRVLAKLAAEYGQVIDDTRAQLNLELKRRPGRPRKE